MVQMIYGQKRIERISPLEAAKELQTMHEAFFGKPSVIDVIECLEDRIEQLETDRASVAIPVERLSEAKTEKSAVQVVHATGIERERAAMIHLAEEIYGGGHHA